MRMAGLRKEAMALAGDPVERADPLERADLVDRVDAPQAIDVSAAERKPNEPDRWGSRS